MLLVKSMVINRYLRTVDFGQMGKRSMSDDPALRLHRIDVIS